MVFRIFSAALLQALFQPFSICAEPAINTGYIGQKTCVSCHNNESVLWSKSHHKLAMQVASQQTVLGNFSKQEFDYFGTKSVFYKKDNRYYVKTDGEDGKLADFEIKYTFGVYPLQQYLIEQEGGRLQALGIAWDSRPESEQGQRWFHLYPDKKIIHIDPLHWTKPQQNWNLACAECHSTNLIKNFDSANANYQTSWSEINVSCEACHGPAEDHISWTKTGKPVDDTSKGFPLNLSDPHTWIPDQPSGNARRKPAQKLSDTQISTCARCHSRRSRIWGEYQHGSALLDTHVPVTLDEGLYEADGQMVGEVYVYGSFVQSKMYQKGVTCSDCHDPHSLTLRVEGNQLCTQCHSAEKYDAAKHHFHKSGSESGQCITCHMPAKNYMIIDKRHDHSFKIPRPDLSDKVGSPNVCIECHKKKDNRWAQNTIEKWYDVRPSGQPHYAQALYAGRNKLLNGEKLLVGIINNEATPDIARASATSLLTTYLNPGTLKLTKALQSDSDPMVRLSTLKIVDVLPDKQRVEFASKLLDDPVRAVRMRAASVIAGYQQFITGKDINSRYEKALEEYIASLQTNADDPTSQTNLGNLYLKLQNYKTAEKHFKMAITLNPHYPAAYINLADLYRQTGEEIKGEAELIKAIDLMPGVGVLHYSYGLSLIRKAQTKKAIAALNKATQLNSNDAYMKYVYALALDSVDRKQESINNLKQAHELEPANQEILFALVTFLVNNQQVSDANQYVKELLQVAPKHKEAHKLANHIKSLIKNSVKKN